VVFQLRHGGLNKADHMKYSTPTELPEWVISYLFYKYSMRRGVSATTLFSTLDSH
jgi:hypothetical protein